jgi:hypothetical protein
MRSGVMLGEGGRELYICRPLVLSLTNDGPLPGFDQRREQLIEISLGGFGKNPASSADSHREVASRIHPPSFRHQVHAANPAMADGQYTQEAADSTVDRGQSEQELADRTRELVTQKGLVIGEQCPLRPEVEEFTVRRKLAGSEYAIKLKKFI